jgi:hypothetical protein
MAGRSVSTLPLIWPFARLPNVRWIAPPWTDVELMKLLTILSWGGSPALALSAGNVCRAPHDNAIGGFATSASGSASTI